MWWSPQSLGPSPGTVGKCLKTLVIYVVFVLMGNVCVLISFDRLTKPTRCFQAIDSF